jgi:hypothetical protein
MSYLPLKEADGTYTVALLKGDDVVKLYTVPDGASGALLINFLNGGSGGQPVANFQVKGFGDERWYHEAERDPNTVVEEAEVVEDGPSI